MEIVLGQINDFLWSVPVLGLILTSGLWLTIRTGAAQLRLLPRALEAFGRKLRGKGEDGSFRALCTALAATVGTGNIAAVAGAIALGGPGAVFWMWVSGILGMVIKYAESTLAVRFRVRLASGEWVGGPMYYITRGLGEKWSPMARSYCIFGLAASFGVGNAAQISAVMEAGRAAGETLDFPAIPNGRLLLGLVMAVVVLHLLRRGPGGVGRAAELLIPLVSGMYIALCLTALWIRREALIPALGQIFEGACSPRAVTGGMVGSVLATIRVGVSRGTFTNEAGMGTAAIAHAAADVTHPAEQGLMGIMEVFLDTIVICTLTALLILTSGAEIPYGSAAGAELTAKALTASFGPWVTALLWGCLSLFALATILGWGLYAGRCVEFLFGRIRWEWFAVCQAVCVVLGAVVESRVVWMVSELLNGLMAIPNLAAVLMLGGEVVRLTNDQKVCYNREAKNDTARYDP